MIFGRWKLPVAENVYIRNGSGINIGFADLQYLSVNKNV
jgi:hypothetical protein